MERLVFNIAEHKLEELEKYGFKYNHIGFYIFSLEFPYGCSRIIIDEDTLYISGAGEYTTLVKLYDLIKDGLVVKEKKDDKN